MRSLPVIIVLGSLALAQPTPAVPGWQSATEALFKVLTAVDLDGANRLVTPYLFFPDRLPTFRRLLTAPAEAAKVALAGKIRLERVELISQNAQRLEVRVTYAAPRADVALALGQSLEQVQAAGGQTARLTLLKTPQGLRFERGGESNLKFFSALFARLKLEYLLDVP